MVNTRKRGEAACGWRRMRQVLMGLLWAGVLSGRLPATAVCLTTPIMQGQDPSVTMVNGTYYLVQSDGCRIHLRASLTLNGLASTRDTVIYNSGCPTWAPELHYINDRWYLYYSHDDAGDDSHFRGYVAESQGANPLGPYTNRGILFDGFWNIDGSVLTTGSGQLYYICSGNQGGTQNLYIAPMSNPYTLSGPLALLSEPTEGWERIGTVNEGPWGVYHGRRLFIVYSASGCWTDDYTLGLLTLTGSNPLDRASWTKSGPVFSKQPGAYGPGHNSVVVDTAGDWWNVYHANNSPGEGCGNLRQLRAQRMFWRSDNTPDFGAPVPIGSMVTEDPDFLAARFPLDETAGTTAAGAVCDAMGTAHGAPVWLNPGLQFNGSSDFVECGADLGNDVQHALTLAAWVRPDSFSDWAGIVTKGTNVSPYALQVWGDGSLRFSANWGAPGGGAGEGTWNSDRKLTVNQWQHVAATYDGSRLRFYIDGVPDSTQPDVALQFGVANESLIIGADLAGGDEYFEGAIFDVRVYGRALADDEVRGLSDTAPFEVTPPVLQATPAPGAPAFIFSWLGNIASFDLYASPDLAPPAAWSLVDGGPSFVSNQWTVTLPAGTNHQHFYRLQQW